MGENYYSVGNNGMELFFGEDSEDWGCLCTWPINDQEQLTPDRVRSLALLGAAVALACGGNLPHPILPSAVPQWIRDGIKRIIPIQEKNEIV